MTALLSCQKAYIYPINKNTQTILIISVNKIRTNIHYAFIHSLVTKKYCSPHQVYSVYTRGCAVVVATM